MRKFQCLLFVWKRLYICNYIICTTVPLDKNSAKVQLMQTGHILELYCVRRSNAAPFCKNYAKVYFDAKHLQKGLNEGS